LIKAGVKAVVLFNTPETFIKIAFVYDRYTHAAFAKEAKMRFVFSSIRNSGRRIIAFVYDRYTHTIS
jgi:hypothetical protein